GISGKRIAYVPNGVVRRTDAPAAASEAEKRVIGLKERGIFTVVYVGGFARANALETLAQASSLLPDGIAVVLVGKGEYKGELMTYAAQKNLRNLYFEEYVSKDQTPGVLRQADCLYIGARKSALYRYGIGMNKLYDYMLSARPILYGIDAPDNEVSGCGCGVCIKAQNMRALADGILRIRAMPAQERDRMGARGREYVLAHRDYATLAQQFLDALS
ncbi:MAG: glycosyltransferase, partial [Acetanaerobacterium sp.]